MAVRIKTYLPYLTADRLTIVDGDPVFRGEGDPGRADRCGLEVVKYDKDDDDPRLVCEGCYAAMGGLPWGRGAYDLHQGEVGISGSFQHPHALRKCLSSELSAQHTYYVVIRIYESFTAPKGPLLSPRGYRFGLGRKESLVPLRRDAAHAAC